jgi:hypothetical protein
MREVLQSRWQEQRRNTSPQCTYAVTSLAAKIDLGVVYRAYRNATPVGSSKQTSVFLYAISATATAVRTGVMQVNYC